MTTCPEGHAIQEWWSGAQEPFTELQESLDDSQHAVDRADFPALGC